MATLLVGWLECLLDTRLGQTLNKLLRHADINFLYYNLGREVDFTNHKQIIANTDSQDATNRLQKLRCHISLYALTKALYFGENVQRSFCK